VVGGGARDSMQTPLLNNNGEDDEDQQTPLINKNST